MGQLVGFLLHPPLSEIAKRLGKMLKYTPHFQSAFGTAASRGESAHCVPTKQIQGSNFMHVRRARTNHAHQS